MQTAPQGRKRMTDPKIPHTNEHFARPDWPMNAWYAAAWDVDVKRALLARQIAGRKIVLYRRQDGTPAALNDACWHRLLPLSMGKLEGDRVVCGYHGLHYDSHGRCTHMPSQDTINPAARVPALPVVERHRFVWVWPGDPALADPRLIPDMHWNHDPEWAADGRTIKAACNYKLVLDNLMDLTHETFVHASSIGNAAVAEAPFTTTHGPNMAEVARWMIDIEPPPFWKGQLFRKTGKMHDRVDRWQIIRFEAPCTIVIDVGCAPTGTGAPQGDRSAGVNGRVLNTVTPETETTCLYHWAFSRNYLLGEQNLTTELREGVAGIFREDELVLEAQQIALNENPGKTFYNINIDAGAVWARKLIDAMVDREHALKVAAE
jgi:phenylpropionate dioxygenase-like ring-hydroxylating dioxygenase large terminal subunit